MRTIADFQGRSNNLGFARWIAAVLVIFSHAYGVLGLGPDPLEQLSGGQVSFGGLAVALFLFASGFFVCRSVRQKSGRQFFRSRMLRLYPAFAVVILLSVFVLGPLATTLSAGAYFSSPGTWSYLLYLVMVPRYFLPGVFETNPVNHVNASLWTMILEALCYLALFIAGKLKLLRKRLVPLYLSAYVLSAVALFGLRPGLASAYVSYLRPLYFFAAGVIFHIYRERISLDGRISLISGVLFIALFALGRANLAMVTCLPWLMAAMIFARRQLPEAPGRLGDYSYALYLTAFPLQQLWRGWVPGSGAALHVLLVLVSSAAVVLPLYYGVEKRFSEKAK